MATGTTSTSTSCRRASASGGRPELVEVGGLGDVGQVALELVEREVEQRHGQATVAGGAVLSRITSSVARSMRGLAGASPRAMASTIRVAVAAISWSGWWMVVSGGPIHSVTRQVVVADDGQVLGHPQAELAGGTQHAERLEVGAGEDRGRPVGPVEQVHAVRVAAADEEVAVPDSAGSTATPASSSAVR